MDLARPVPRASLQRRLRQFLHRRGSRQWPSLCSRLCRRGGLQQQQQRVHLGVRSRLRFGSDAAQALLAVYDPLHDRWIFGQSLPGIWIPGLAAANGKLYSFGGLLADLFGPVETIPAVMEFDAAAGWSSRGELTVARHSPAAALLDGVLYVTGGSSSVADYPGAPLATVEAARVQ